MKKIIFLFLILIFCSGCSNNQMVKGLLNKQFNPAYLVLGNADSEIIYISNEYKIIHSVKNDDRFSTFTLSEDKKFIYALSDGTYTGSKPFLYKYELKTGKEVEKITFNIVPYRFVISQGKAYIASSNLQQGGVPFVVLDLQTKKQTTFLTKGIVSSMLVDKNEVYMAINPGGKDLYGEFSNVYKLIKQDSNYTITPILNEKIELPPGDMYIENGKLYTVYTGFAYGPKPDWVKEPEKYTDKFIVYNLSSGKQEKEITLANSFPQKITKKGNDFLINHYTDLDMTGKGITVIDGKNLEEKEFLSIENPAYIDYNRTADMIVSSDPATSVVNFIKKNGSVQQVNIEENCSLVRYVE